MTCIFDVTELSKEEADRFEQNGPGLASKTFGAIGTGIGAVATTTVAISDSIATISISTTVVLAESDNIYQPTSH